MNFSINFASKKSQPALPLNIKYALNSIQSLSQKRKKCAEEVHFSAILMQLGTI
jgi:hypothetical protein